MRTGCYWLVAGSLVGTVPAAAQAPAGPRLEFSASTRIRAERWSWFDPGSRAPTFEPIYGFLAARSHLVARLANHAWLDAVADVQNTSWLGLPDRAGAPPPQGDLGLGATYFAPHRKRNDTRAFLHQGYLSLRARGRPATYLRIGRFEYLDGLETVPAEPTLAWVKRNRAAARLVGTFAFSHVGRSFDGVTAALDRPGLNLTGVAGRPRQGGFELDGMTRIDRVDLAGVALTLKPVKSDRGARDARLFYLYYGDRRTPAGQQVVKVDNRPLAARQQDADPIAISQWGGHFIQQTAAGPGIVDLFGWGVIQRGQWGVLDHRAWAFAAELGHQWPAAPGRPWLRVGYQRSSGDRDPGDDRHETFFQTLPTVRQYALFPFYNLMNTEDRFAQVILRSRGGQVTVRVDGRALRLSEPADLWYVGSGAGQAERAFGFGGRPSGGQRALGTALETAVSWDVNRRLNLNGFAGWVSGGDVVRGLYDGRTGSFVYLEALVRL